MAPVLACVGLLASLWLVLTNFTLVTGASVAVRTVLALVPVAGLVLGVAFGERVARAGVPEPGLPQLVGIRSLIR